MYGILVSTGVLLAIIYGRFLLLKKGLYNADEFWGVAFWALVGGIIGARLYHVIDFWSIYSINPLRIFEIWKGGMAIYGGLIGGTVSLIYFIGDKSKVKIYLDTISTTLPVAQAIGRIGNYVNQELYGKQTQLPWGIRIEGNDGLFHPLFLYEALLNMVLGIFLVHKYNKINQAEGEIFGKYLIGYGIIRFLLEFLRINPWQVYGLNVAQVISILAIGIGYGIIKKIIFK